MFGYITPLKSELKVREFEYFKSYYCGLCHEIKNNFGNIPRLCLNYDLTFIGFLLDGLRSEPIKLKSIKCIKHPTNNIIISSETDGLTYSSNLSILLVDYKLKDNIEDDKSIKGKFCKFILSPSTKKSLIELNSISSIIYDNLSTLSLLEKSKSFSSLDEICHPFSDIMGTILKSFPSDIEDDSDILRDNLYWLGYYMGKWIYLIDALDDLKDDINKSQFNPYNILYNKDSLDFDSLIKIIIDEVDFMIISCLSKCNDYMNSIPFKKHFNIIENTITLGMMNKYYEILNKINISKEV